MFILNVLIFLGPQEEDADENIFDPLLCEELVFLISSLNVLEYQLPHILVLKELVPWVALRSGCKRIEEFGVKFLIFDNLELLGLAVEALPFSSDCLNPLSG